MKKIHVILLSILLAGGVLRFYALGWETFSFDEVVLYHAAEEYTRGNFVFNFYSFDTPPLGKYLYSVAFWLFGLSESAFRIIPAIFGTSAIAVTFFVANRLYKNIHIAIFASVLTAFSIIHLQFSRLAVLEAIVAPFYILSLYFIFQLAEGKGRRDWLWLGVFVALGLLVKYIMLYAVVTILIFALYRGLIRVSKNPRVSISIDKKLSKSILAGVVIFLAVWPFALFPMQTDISINVDYNGPHGGSLRAPVPTLLLTLGNVGGAALGQRTDVNIFNSQISQFPLIGYFVLFIAKESLAFVAIFFAGIYAAANRKKDFDKIFLLSIVIFFLFLWLQRYGFTYRYITVMIPIMAIVGAGSLTLIKSKTHKIFAVSIISAILFANAVFYHPAYTMHYNPLNNILGFEDPEAYYSEGTKEAIEYAGGCSKVSTNYDYTTQPYIGDKLVGLDENPECILIGYAETPNKKELIDYAERNCNLEKEVIKQDIKFFHIYRC